MERLSNNHFKELVHLKQSGRWQEGQPLLVEGRRLIEQALEGGARVREFILRPDTGPQDHELLKQFFNIPVYELDAPRYNRICQTLSPQPLAALLEPVVKTPPTQGFLLFLHNVADPGNLGTIFRAAQAAGVEGVLLSPGCCQVFNAKCIRASLGAVFTLPWAIKEEDWLAGRDDTLYTAVSGGTDLFAYRPINPEMILVIGSEAHGVEKKLLQNAKRVLSIPMAGKMESLNAAMAATVCLFVLGRQRAELSLKAR